MEKLYIEIGDIVAEMGLAGIDDLNEIINSCDEIFISIGDTNKKRKYTFQQEEQKVIDWISLSKKDNT